MMKMNNLRSILTKLIPGFAQLGVILAILLTAIFFYGLGSGSGQYPSTKAKGGSNSAEGATSRPVSGSVAREKASHPADADGDGVIFTCSMHPQIQQDDPGNCPICGMELVEQQVPEASSASASDVSSTHRHEPELLGYACSMNCVPPLEEAGDCPVCGMEMQAVFDDAHASSASVEGDPLRRFTMSEGARALASIQTTSVRRMVPTKSLRLVGELEVDPSRRAHISADVGGRIDSLSAEFVGDEVTAGEKLVLLYSPELLAVQQEFLQAIAASKRLPSSSASPVRTTNETAAQAARERLRLAGLSIEQIDEIEASGKATDQVVIRAPVGGTVTMRHAEEGEYVEKGERILEIVDLSQLWAVAHAYESDLPWLKKGTPVEFISDAFPGESFRGAIEWIDPVMSTATRTVSVRLTVENPDRKLRPGMYLTAQARSELARSELDEDTQLVIPTTAPLITGKRAVVYLKVPDTDRPTYQGVEVLLGQRTDQGYMVLDGLNEGQKVVTNGAFQIDSALQIIARPSMMNPQGGGAGGAGHANHGGSPSQVIAPQTSEESVTLDGDSEAVLSAILPHYLAVQQALATDDVQEAMRAWRDAEHTLHSLPASDPSVDQLGDILHQVSAGSDIDRIRREFESLSDLLIAWAERHGNPGTDILRLAYCPMVDNDRGASWLQTEPVIANPYFGAAMHRCGAVMEEFAPTTNEEAAQ